MKKSTTAISALLVFAAAQIILPASSFAAGHSYKVESVNGVPMITMDGNPVRSRMFWGRQQGYIKSLHELGPTWKEVSFEFKPKESCDKSGLHLRMGTAAGDIWISEMRIENLDTGEVANEIKMGGDALDPNFQFWCAGDLKTAPLKISMDNTDGADGKVVHIKIMEGENRLEGLHFFMDNTKISTDCKYRAVIRIKCTPERTLHTNVYRQYDDYKLLGIREPTLDPQVKLAKDAGVNFVTYMADAIWEKPDGTFDYSEIDSTHKRIIAANPKAKIIPRIALDPPKWWMDSHPEDVMRNSDGTPNPKYTSMASPNYRKDAGEALKRYIEYCQKNYPSNMAGYHPAGGNTHEWFYGSTWDRPLTGYDKYTEASWRKWLEKKYGDDKSLQASWNRKDVTIASAKVPSAEERRSDKARYLMDPQKCAELIDFNLYLQDEMADVVKYFAKITRQTAGPDRLSVFFYGYTFEFMRPYNGPAFSGHYALEQIIACPDIDVLCGPISYSDRNYGGGKTTMGATESILLGGKVWLDEDDTSTHLSGKIGANYPGRDLDVITPERTIKVLSRNMGHEVVRNITSWWMDLGGTGWFNDPILWEKVMKPFAKIDRSRMRNPAPYNPDVRLVMDERSICYVGGEASAGSSAALITSGARKNMNRCGTPFGHYLLSDVIEKGASGKLNAYLTTYALSSEQRKAMRKTAENSASIFAWVPAIIDTDTNKFSTQAVKEATGFDVKLIDADIQAMAKSTPEGKAIGLPETFGTGTKVKPLLSPKAEDSDIVLARFTNGEPAVVVRTNGKYPQLFCAVPDIPRELYGYMIEISGIHRYTKQPAAVYASGNLVSITATEDGAYEFIFPEEKNIVELPGGKKLGKGKRLNLDMKKADTKLLKLD